MAGKDMDWEYVELCILWPSYNTTSLLLAIAPKGNIMIRFQEIYTAYRVFLYKAFKPPHFSDAAALCVQVFYSTKFLTVF